MTRGERRRPARDRQRRQGARSWLEIALRVAQALGPLAARHGLLVALVPPEATDSECPEVVAIDRCSGVLACAGCGGEVTSEVVGTTRLGGMEHATTTLLIRALCAACMPPNVGARA